MNATQQTLLWRILAASMVIGAAGLGAYYLLIHQPLQQAIDASHDATATLRAEITDEAQRELEPRALPVARVTQACEGFREVTAAFSESSDPHGNLFAVQELARRAGLENYSIDALDEATVFGAKQTRISLALEGTGTATDRLFSNIDKHKKAGALASLEIQRHAETEDDIHRRVRRRRPEPAVFDTSAELHAYAISSPSSLASERCDALAP